MPTANVLNPPIPTNKDTRLQWGNLNVDAAALAIGGLAETKVAPYLVITPSIYCSNKIYHALKFFFPEAPFPILRFADGETLPYDHFSPHADIISNRLLTLHQLPDLRHGIAIVAITTLMHRLCPPHYLETHTLLLTCGDLFSIAEKKERLVQAGYRSVAQVMEHGEFAQRGSILDIYPMGTSEPYRIELLDDEIVSIRSFDPSTQRSIKKIKALSILPAFEYPLTEGGIQYFRQNWRLQFPGNPQASSLYQQVSEGIAAPGLEYYLPLFFEDTHTFFDYMNHLETIFLLESIETSAQQYWKDIEERYEQRRYDTTRPLFSPHALFLSYADIASAMKPLTQIQIYSHPCTEKSGHFNFNISPVPKGLINYQVQDPLLRLAQFSKSCLEDEGRLLFCAETAGRQTHIQDLLHTIDDLPHPVSIQDFPAFMKNNLPVALTTARLTEGFIILSPHLSILSELALLGEVVRQTTSRGKTPIHPDLVIRNLIELRVGDPVVHIQHGIGRYLGLQTIETGGHTAEYLSLEYANHDRIYVPIAALHFITRYVGAHAEQAPLQKLGGKQWDKIKSDAIKRIHDTAAELLEIYTRRKATPGFAFQLPQQEYDIFKRSFPFEETPDQVNTIKAIIKDMSAPCSMDRLVCGDVGFGKTEVAMRAAFMAVYNHKQVAILVPTTLLAEQHAHNFKDRFASWPVRIAALSRLRSNQERQTIRAALKSAQIDIIIGTHTLLSSTIIFKNLGLLIVDEEHRFGVRQKERIKAIRANLDILTLTATPIPRTLNMALAGTRDLSIIATPPAGRLSVKTFIHEYSQDLIREAILREILRGGQAYFLHNDVSTIAAVADKIQAMVPEARLAIAHGQLREKILENIMSDFYHQKYNLLVCSTIIESGIDIPHANTIIINRADRFGLAQLHQLRGRVGRSHHQAYAYLLIPPVDALTLDAKKRLEAIDMLGEVGMGFNLASYDLEIRGSGALLGEEQSGHIEAIGFTLYLELLEEAVQALKSGKTPSFDKPLCLGADIDLGISALLPADYVPDVNVRLTFYKQLSNCKTSADLHNLKAALIDRFGALPIPAQHLLQQHEIKQQAECLGITKLKIAKKYLYLYLEDPAPHLKLEELVKRLQTQPQQYHMEGHTLRITLPATRPDNDSPTPFIQREIKALFEPVK